MSDAILSVRPTAALRPGRPPGATLALGAVVALLAGLAGSAIVAIGPRAGEPVAPAPRAERAPPPAWIDIVRPVHIYGLEARELTKLQALYAARRRNTGDVREDVLDFGPWNGEHLSLRLGILRGAGEAMPPLDTAIVRQAAAVGLAIQRSKRPETLPTRFGMFEIADVETSGPGVALSCSGFRLAVASPVMTFNGFACGAGGRPIARHVLACLIDRLDLASAGEDRALVDFFATTDLRRGVDCEGTRLAPDGPHAAWLDAKPAPPRGRSASRRRRHHRH